MDKMAPRKMDHLLGEERIQVLHDWIANLCDPEINFCSTLLTTFEKTCDRLSASSPREGRKAQPLDKFLRQHGIEEGRDGPIFSTLEDGTILEGRMKEGVPHGFFRIINVEGDVDLFCCMVKGIMHGVCWRGLKGGGFLVSGSTDFTSNDTMYLYPDCRTALVGNFYRGQMVSGQLAEVIGSTEFCCDSCGVLQPLLSRPKGQEYSYDPSTAIRISSQPLLPDPYEEEFVSVGCSTVEGAGQGLFAKVDIEIGTVIGFYNGIRVPPAESSEIISKDEYRILLDDEHDLDIPVDMTSLEDYKATLAHKVCHSFSPNSEFETFCHPRFGLIKCITSTRDIRAKEEIFVDYRYNLSVSPSWYKVAWAKHQKFVRRMPDWKYAVNFGTHKVEKRSSVYF